MKEQEQRARTIYFNACCYHEQASESMRIARVQIAQAKRDKKFAKQLLKKMGKTEAQIKRIATRG